MAPKRLIFMGSPPFAVPSLRALHAAGHEIVAVYSQPPRPAGRGQKLQKTPVHEAAEELGLDVRVPEKLKGADLDAVLAPPCDAICVVGYGLLLPKALVDSRLCLNVHPSALPRWRGATPVQSALMAGDTFTEVCIMRLEAGMDTGPVYDRTRVEIPADWNTADLNDCVWHIGARRLVHVVEHAETMVPVPQAGEATRAVKISAETRPIDWNKPAQEVHNHIRALAPSPGATACLDGEVVKVLRADSRVHGFTGSRVHGGTGLGGVEAGQILAVDAHGVVVACGSGAVRLLEIQRAGKRAMPAAEAARGWGALAVGQRFGC